MPEIRSMPKEKGIEQGLSMLREGYMCTNLSWAGSFRSKSYVYGYDAARWITKDAGNH